MIGSFTNQLEKLANFADSSPLHLLDEPAIVVDLDGTLVATDTLWESIICFLKGNPLRIFVLISWLFAGKAQFKHRLAQSADICAGKLPYCRDFLDWLDSEKARGRRLILATAADRTIADKVARHLGIFDDVIASDEQTNVAGHEKLSRISSRLKGAPFAYAGDALVDLAVWGQCCQVIVVAPRPGVLRELKRSNISLHRYFEGPRPGSWLKAIRAHQWIKNILIFVPILTSHRVADPGTLAKGLVGFFSFSLAASAAYILNDICDLDADRSHSIKRQRPFASGSLSIPSGLIGSFCLLAVSIFLSYLLSSLACITVASYFVASISYSVYLKRTLLLDVIALVVFYTLRVHFGGIITGIEISVWLSGFSVFSFFSMAAAKRINDLAGIKSKTGTLARRAYGVADKNMLVAQAAAAGNIAVLVLVLYVISPQVAALYRRPDLLLFLCPLLLYWFNRTTALANRGSLPSDPILFAMRDRSSHTVLAMILGVVALAI